MDDLEFVLLAVLATYLLGLLVGLAGIRKVREPLRYHLGALVIFAIEVAFVAWAMGDGLPADFQRGATWMIGPVALWWAHQLWSHRDRPDPKKRPTAPPRPTPPEAAG